MTSWNWVNMIVHALGGPPFLRFETHDVAVFKGVLEWWPVQPSGAPSDFGQDHCLLIHCAPGRPRQPTDERVGTRPWLALQLGEERTKPKAQQSNPDRGRSRLDCLHRNVLRSQEERQPHRRSQSRSFPAGAKGRPLAVHDTRGGPKKASTARQSGVEPMCRLRAKIRTAP